jgi:hypothetical protein
MARRAEESNGLAASGNKNARQCALADPWQCLASGIQPGKEQGKSPASQRGAATARMEATPAGKSARFTFRPQAERVGVT